MSKVPPTHAPSTAALPARPPQMHGVLSRRLVKLVAVAVLLFVLSVWQYHAWNWPGTADRARSGLIELQTWNEKKLSGEAEWTVPLETHIMSKCPDARDCLLDLIVPLMVRLSPKINFTLSFIGTPTEPDGGVACMHGPTECLGNILELCAANEYPDPKVYLGFTMCLSRKYEQIPSRALISDCAMEHGISFDKLNDCASKADGSFGIGLLRDSVERSKSLGVTKSCTVRLNNEVRCIRDGGEWKDCDKGYTVDNFADEIEKLYKEKNER